MYTVLLALAIGIAAGCLWGFVLFPGAYIVGPLFGIVAFLVVFILVSRRMLKQIQPKLTEAQRLAQSGQLKQAVEALEEARAFTKWQVMLEGQIDAQIGMFAYHEDEDRAYEHLKRASLRAPDAYLLRAAIEFRRGELANAKATCEEGLKANKKYAMLWNFYAWLHHQDDDADGALDVLNRAQKADPENTATRGNAERVQNGQKLDMRQFGEMWYLLKIERPPQHMGVMQGRKGFRQPKGTGKKPKKKRK